jgi:hypothetical protein
MWGSSKKQPGDKERKKKERGRLLFAALALGQHTPSLLIYLLLVPPAQ